MTDRLDLLPDATVVVDADRRVVAANPAAARLTGYPSTELTGALLPALLDARDDSGAALWAGGWHPSSRLRSVRAVPEQLVTLRRRMGLIGGSRMLVNVMGSVVVGGMF